MDLNWNRKEAAIRRLPDARVLGQARMESRRDGGTVRIPRAILGNPQRLLAKVERRHGFFDEAGWMELDPSLKFFSRAGVAPALAASQAAGPGKPGPKAATPGLRPSDAPDAPVAHAAAPCVCALIPCYNVAAACGVVARKTLDYVDHLILVDDGSTDGTGNVLKAVEREAAGRASLIALPDNRGKGNALFAGFCHALERLPFDALIVLDGDGQHRPQDIPAMVDAWRQGGEMVIGERLQAQAMPWRSRVGNQSITRMLRRFYPNCPTDTQSGFRLMERDFIVEAVERIRSSRYETEFQMLLLALRTGVTIRSVEIPTIYLDHNRASNFRPIVDSWRIFATLLRWK
jgi:hypothetical protein